MKALCAWLEPALPATMQPAQTPELKRNSSGGPATYSSLLTFVPYVVNGWNDKPLRYPKSRIRVFADQNDKLPTRAEFALDKILLRLNNGILNDQYRRQHVISGKWIVDFFFPEVRLAIEVDGSYHSQERKDLDAIKEQDCRALDITLIRIRNGEVFGDRKRLVDKLRAGWLEAKKRKNQIIGKPHSASTKLLMPVPSERSAAFSSSRARRGRSEEERRRDDEAWGLSRLAASPGSSDC